MYHRVSPRAYALTDPHGRIPASGYPRARVSCVVYPGINRYSATQSIKKGWSERGNPAKSFRTLTSNNTSRCDTCKSITSENSVSSWHVSSRRRDKPLTSINARRERAS